MSKSVFYTIIGIIADVWCIIGIPLLMLTLFLFSVVAVGLIAAGWKVLFP
jgi:hypothetical protein